MYIPDRYGDGKMSSCLMKSACPNPTHLNNRVKCCQPGDKSCPPPPPPQPCPCSSCPCPPGPLPRTCDRESVSASLPFCDKSQPVERRVKDLMSRLTREETINLVEQVNVKLRVGIRVGVGVCGTGLCMICMHMSSGLCTHTHMHTSVYIYIYTI